VVKKIKKVLDKQQGLCYNKDTKKRETPQRKGDNYNGY
jgi:hypothetical protein